MRQRIAHRAVHLRDAAQRVRVLHPAAVAMRFANLAAFEHLAQIRRSLHLSAVRTRFVNAFIEGRVGAFQRVAAETAQHVGGIHQRFRSQQRQRAHRQHALRAVDERDGFLRFQHQRLDLRSLQRVGAGNACCRLYRCIRLRRSTPAPDAPAERDRRSRPRCPATARKA